MNELRFQMRRIVDLQDTICKCIPMLRTHFLKLMYTERLRMLILSVFLMLSNAGNAQNTSRSTSKKDSKLILFNGVRDHGMKQIGQHLVRRSKKLFYWLLLWVFLVD